MAITPLTRKNQMNKLLEIFIANPTEKNRIKLQNYLNKHLMAVCMATPEQNQILRANGFQI
jgi:hypothetical protein